MALAGACAGHRTVHRSPRAAVTILHSGPFNNYRIVTKGTHIKYCAFLVALAFAAVVAAFDRAGPVAVATGAVEKSAKDLTAAAPGMSVVPVVAVGQGGLAAILGHLPQQWHSGRQRADEDQAKEVPEP